MKLFNFQTIFSVLGPLIMCPLISFNAMAFTEEINLDEITFSATSEAEASNVLANENVEGFENENIQASSLDDLLKFSPSATTQGGPRSSSESIQIRGLNSNKLYIYVDGVKQNFRTDHSTMLAVDYDNLKVAKVEKDNSDFSRSGSLGGGLVLETKSASDYLSKNKDSGFNLKYSYQGSNDENAVNVKSYGRNFLTSKKGRSGFKDEYIIGAGSKNTHNQELSNEQTLANSWYQDKSLFFKQKFIKDQNNSFELALDYFKRNDSSPINPTLDPPDDLSELNGKNTIERMTFSGQYKKEIFHHLFDLRLGSSTQKLNKERNSDGEKEKRKLVTNQVSSNYLIKHRNNIKSHLGLEIIQDDLEGKRDSAILESYPSGRSRNYNAFYQMKQEFKYIDYSAGAKLTQYQLENNGDNKNVSHSDWSAKIQSTLKPVKDFNLALSLSKTVNTPKIQEVYADGLHHPGDGFFIADNYFVANPDLQTEVAKTFEAAFSYDKKIHDNAVLELKYAKYWSHFDNYIYLEKIDRAIFDGEYGTTTFKNAKQVSMHGDEVSMNLALFDLDLGVTYTKVRGLDKKLGTYIADLPADQYTYNLTYHFYESEVELGYLGVMALKQDRINRDSIERTDETPSYFVHNIFMKKSFKDFILNTRIDNITNREYRKHASNIFEVGRDYKISIEYKINL